MTMVLKLEGIDFPVSNPSLSDEPLNIEGTKFLLDWGRRSVNPTQDTPLVSETVTDISTSNDVTYAVQETDCSIDYNPTTKALRFDNPFKGRRNYFSVAPSFARNNTDEYLFISWIKIPANAPAMTSVADLGHFWYLGDPHTSFDFMFAIDSNDRDITPTNKWQFKPYFLTSSGAMKTFTSNFDGVPELETDTVYQLAVVMTPNQSMKLYINNDGSGDHRSSNVELFTPTGTPFNQQNMVVGVNQDSTYAAETLLDTYRFGIWNTSETTQSAAEIVANDYAYNVGRFS